MFLTLLGAAHAFCGTYVGPLGSELENSASQVILARDGNLTTLTLANDFAGDVSDFGLVIPVPEILTAADVSVVDASLFAALDDYTAPRLVSYDCDDFRQDTALDDADTAAAGGGGSADGVTVEESFTVGAYQIDVLSATGSEGLLSWLDAQGFDLPSAAAPVMQEYIDGNFYFLAARVNLSELPGALSYLSPLQFRYESASFALPIRIGTTVSPGVQEVVIHSLNPSDGGRVSISNYPAATLEDDCMIPEDTTDVGTFYQDQLATAFAAGTWLEEYSWGLGWCDPCSSEPPSAEQLLDMGANWTGDTWITRLRVRYTPEQATQDLMLYQSGIQETSQVKYIVYNAPMEEHFPVCGLGMVEDPQTCSADEEGGDDSSPGDTAGDGGDKSIGSCGCSSTSSSTGLLFLGLAGAFALRRRLAGG
ncbi:MAG TPA: DUF2330 domain-containing protein [Myxococcota bacterium]|nr:DUF2330 domain-containing protein [Myxococcota bacterium]